MNEIGLQGTWRVYGLDFAGTMHAFVSDHLPDKYITTLGLAFEKGSLLYAVYNPYGCKNVFIGKSSVIRFILMNARDHETFGPFIKNTF